MNVNTFDRVINRRNSNSLKWNVKDSELPMWVADMDFQTAPEILEEMQKRVEHGIFGYSDIPDEWYEAYIQWWKNRHCFAIEKEWLTFCTGIIPAISSAVRKLTSAGENVLIQTPVYNIFFHSIINNGRNPIESPLVYKDGTYEIDFVRLEKELSNPQTTMMIFCNPHNPVGKIWSKDTLKRVGELCEKNHVIVISDEIHCDLTSPGCGYTPFAAASDICKKISITCIAPTKAFNIAGLQTAAVMVPNEYLHHKMWRALNTDEVAEPNVFAIQAAVAAFTKGGYWLDELREYLQVNRDYVEKFMLEHLPELKPIPAQATYLLWVDGSKLFQDAKEFAEFLRRETGLYVSEGSQYGESGKHFLRINLACSKTTVEEGMHRLLGGVTKYKAIAKEKGVK